MMMHMTHTQEHGTVVRIRVHPVHNTVLGQQVRKRKEQMTVDAFAVQICGGVRHVLEAP
jgi:hypothetical protein